MPEEPLSSHEQTAGNSSAVTPRMAALLAAVATVAAVALIVLAITSALRLQEERRQTECLASLAARSLLESRDMSETDREVRRAVDDLEVDLLGECTGLAS